MKKSYRYRLYPTKRQQEALTAQLADACTLYNAALQERRDAYRKAQHLPELLRPGQPTQSDSGRWTAWAWRISPPVRMCLRRVDKTFKAFFGRAQRGEKAGYPRFKSRSRFDSYTFPSYGDGCKVRDNGKLYCQGIGELKVKWHRPLTVMIKTVTLKREAGRWYVCFSVETDASPLPESPESVGLDVGLESFATFSDGDDAFPTRATSKRLRPGCDRAQRRVARRKKGSHRRRKAVQALQRAHGHVRNQRTRFSSQSGSTARQPVRPDRRRRLEH